ncbi:MAG: hypothetical protein K0U80_15180 [Actinomycetia bacterium]|nr:hypothetical protein [Actinomycetes bacterium]MCH9761564.1 hypothetical protein [Actinomycetes bacterium]
MSGSVTSGNRPKRQSRGPVVNAHNVRLFLPLTTTCVLFAGVIGFAGPAAADVSWVMPNVKDMILARAMKVVQAAANPVEITFETTDTKGNREQYNMSNWSVCWQSPKAGARVPQKDNYVSLGVKRLTDGNCWS